MVIPWNFWYEFNNANRLTYNSDHYNNYYYKKVRFFSSAELTPELRSLNQEQKST